MLGTEGDFTCGHTGYEATAPRRLTRPELDGEDVQMALLHEINTLRIVHRERTVRPGLDADAADALDDGDIGHRVNPT